MDGRLEKWFVFGGKSIVGTIYDDTKGRFKDGSDIRTSNLQHPSDLLKKGDIVKTKNSTYLLGEPAK